MSDDALRQALDDVLRAMPTQRGYRSASASWSADDELVTLTLTVAEDSEREEP